MKNRKPGKGSRTVLATQARLIDKGETPTIRDLFDTRSGKEGYTVAKNGGLRWHGDYDAKGEKRLVPCTGTIRKIVA